VENGAIIRLRFAYMLVWARASLLRQ